MLNETLFCDFLHRALEKICDLKNFGENMTTDKENMDRGKYENAPVFQWMWQKNMICS